MAGGTPLAGKWWVPAAMKSIPRFSRTQSRGRAGAAGHVTREYSHEYPVLTRTRGQPYPCLDVYSVTLANISQNSISIPIEIRSSK